MVLPGNNISHSEIVQQVSHQLSTSPYYSLPPGWLSVREDGPGPGRGGVQAGVRALLLQWRHRHTVNVCLALNIFQPDPRTETNLLLSPLNLFCSYSDNKWYFHSELYCWPSKTSRYYLALASEERLSQTVSDKALKDNLWWGNFLEDVTNSDWVNILIKRLWNSRLIPKVYSENWEMDDKIFSWNIRKI